MDQFELVAEPRRRQILRLIWDGPLAVSSIAAQVDVSIGAVSQHLAKLYAGGLVTVQRDGRRRLYAADRDALAAGPGARGDVDSSTGSPRGAGRARAASSRCPAMTTKIVLERHIAAAPEVVWAFVSTPGGWLEWQGTAAEIVAVPGGVHRVNIRGDAFAGGEVVEVIVNRRISFTWGFDLPGHPLPAGSTLVVIDLVPDGDGTLLRLTQERVPDGFEAVGHGWEYYLGRLAVVATGGNPGPDPNVGRPS